MKRMNHNITFRDLIELRLRRIFEEWEEWPDRPVQPKPFIPPTGTLPNTRKYEMDCRLFAGTQIGVLVDKGYKRAYVKARIKELKNQIVSIPGGFWTKGTAFGSDRKFKVFEFGDYVRVKVQEFYFDPETGERKER